MSTKYVDKVPEKDKKLILDMYFGRDKWDGTKIVTTVDQIAKSMNGRYTKSQIRSVIYAEYD